MELLDVSGLFSNRHLVAKRTSRGPRERERAVAVAYPNTPTNKAGSTNLDQSFACAMAAAVVGPPTLALDAKYNSFDFNLSTPFPIPIRIAKWMNN